MFKLSLENFFAVPVVPAGTLLMPLLELRCLSSDVEISSMLMKQNDFFAILCFI